MIGPDAGIAVGLQFLAHQQAVVAFHPRTALAGRLHLPGNAEQRLDVMTDLMGDHIGLGEVACSGKAPGHLVEELQVEVDLLIARAVERADRRTGEAAGRVHAAAKQHKGRVAILHAVLLEQRAPGVFGVAEHSADEFHLWIVAGRALALLGDCRPALVGQLAEDLQRVLAGEQADHHHDGDAAQTQAAAQAHAAAAPGVHYVVAASGSFPAHELPLGDGGWERRGRSEAANAFHSDP